jgi:hypothetical protein
VEAKDAKKKKRRRRRNVYGARSNVAEWFGECDE